MGKKKTEKNRRKALQKGTKWLRRQQADVDQIQPGAVALPACITAPSEYAGALVCVTAPPSRNGT